MPQTATQTAMGKELRRSHGGSARILRRLWAFRSLYLMVIPGVIFVLIFSYIPILGLQIAFKDYRFSQGIWGSQWAGLSHFEFVHSADFWTAVRNTLTITSLRLVFGFPAPIILALLINEVGHSVFKRVIQTASYLPHFVSWIVIVGLMESLLSPQGGAVNEVIVRLGGNPIFFLGSEAWFRPLVIVSGIWKEIGWGTIIYLAAIAGINPELYEAAVVDGAGRFRQARYITLPSLTPTISILLVLTIPGLINAGWDQIYPMMNPANMGAAEVLDTYILRLGIGQGHYSLTTAIGLVMSVIGTALVLSCNWLSRRIGGSGIW